MTLSNNQLTQICLYLSGQAFTPFTGFNPAPVKFDSAQLEFNLILYNTGLRFIELFDTSRFTIIDTNNVSVACAKGSTLRIIPRNLLSEGFNAALNSETLYWQSVNFDSLSYYFRKNIGIFEISTLTKTLNTHLFRHNIIKTMYDNEYSIEAISSFIGEVSIINTFHYVDSIIKFTPYS